jgi:hypothetical protein
MNSLQPRQRRDGDIHRASADHAHRSAIAGDVGEATKRNADGFLLMAS